MKNRLDSKRIAALLTLTLLVSVAAVWQARRARAFNPQPDPPGKFGMVGIVRGQTLRLNVVNLGPAAEPRQLPPDPCRVVLSFRNADGQPVRGTDGQIIRRAVELQSGESAFLDFDGDQLGVIGDTTGPARAQLRPFVRVNLEPDPGPQIPPDPCRATAEVIDNATFKTSFVMYTGNHNETLVRDR